MKKITLTKRWLEKHGACVDAIEWYEMQTETDPIKLAHIALDEGYFEWVNWAIVHKMNKRQKVQYAVFAAELVLPIYEKKYPYDDRPRQAIEASKEYLKRPSKKTKDAARAAAYDALDALDALDAVDAADVAYAASRAALAAASRAVDVAAYDAALAAKIAGYATGGSATMKKILEYGISILAED